MWRLSAFPNKQKISRAHQNSARYKVYHIHTFLR